MKNIAEHPSKKKTQLHKEEYSNYTPPIRFNMSAKKLALLERFGLELTISHKKRVKVV